MPARRTNLARGLRMAAVIGLAALSAAQAQPISAAPTTAPATVANLSALERANADAVARLYAQIAGESLDGRQTVGQLIDAVEGRDAVMDGLRRAQQIGGPRMIAEGLVQVSLEIDGDRAAQIVSQAVAAHPERSTISPQRLAALLQSWSGRTFGSTGSSGESPVGPMMRVASDEAVGAPTTGVSTLPARPPAWADSPQTASGTAESGGAPLRTARAAEAAARRALRDRLAALPMDGQRTIATASVEQKAFGDAVEAAVDAAKIAGVDYRADGSVEVRVSIDGRQVWRALVLATRPR